MGANLNEVLIDLASSRMTIKKIVDEPDSGVFLLLTLRVRVRIRKSSCINHRGIMPRFRGAAAIISRRRAKVRNRACARARLTPPVIANRKEMSGILFDCQVSLKVYLNGERDSSSTNHLCPFNGGHLFAHSSHSIRHSRTKPTKNR